jgi:hypothetical protein
MAISTTARPIRKKILQSDSVSFLLGAKQTDHIFLERVLGLLVSGYESTQPTVIIDHAAE